MPAQHNLKMKGPASNSHCTNTATCKRYQDTRLANIATEPQKLVVSKPLQPHMRHFRPAFFMIPCIQVPDVML